MTELPQRETERLADLGVARMLAALAALHVTAGAVVATALPGRAAAVVAAADAVAGVVLLATAAVALRLGAGARNPVAGGRRLDLTLVVAALAAATVATALRMIATGATWTGLELPLVVVVAAALPRRHAVGAVAATLAAGGAAAAVVLAGGTGTRAELLGSLLPAAGVLAAAGVALAWRRRVALLTGRLLAAHDTAAAAAVHDQLTGAVNRRGLDMIAAPMVENARRPGEAAHCLFVDVDGFRDLNERHGSGVGDEVLRTVARALTGAVRTTDVVGRWTGDEFVVVGPGTGTSPLELERRVHAALAEAPALPAELPAPRVSIGSATLVPWDEGDLRGLLLRAEQDMRLRRSLRRQRSDRTPADEQPAPRPPVRGDAEANPQSRPGTDLSS